MMRSSSDDTSSRFAMRCAMPCTTDVLPTPALPDEQRVVAVAFGEDVERLIDLDVAADDGIERPLRGRERQVAPHRREGREMFGIESKARIG